MLRIAGAGIGTEGASRLMGVIQPTLSSARASAGEATPPFPATPTAQHTSLKRTRSDVWRCPLVGGMPVWPGPVPMILWCQAEGLPDRPREPPLYPPRLRSPPAAAAAQAAEQAVGAPRLTRTRIWGIVGKAAAAAFLRTASVTVTTKWRSLRHPSQPSHVSTHHSGSLTG